MPGPTQPTPPSSTSSANGLSPEDQPYRVVRKRNRVPLSCAPCRHRKLKCNRGHPCDNCSKRGDTGACSYATPGSRKKGGSSGASTTPDDMQNRIDRLEGLVLSLMTNGGSQPGATAAAQAAISGSRSDSIGVASDLRLDANGADMIPEESEERGEDESEVGDLSQSIGIMKMNDGKAIFASDAHWYAILGEISEVKKYFDNHKEDYMQHLAKVKGASASTAGTSFLLQGTSAKDKGEVMAAYPSKADADRLIARYFNAYDPSVHIIHGPSFQKQYDKHWLNPNETSVVWLGMCFAMMTLALQSYNRAGDEPPEYRGRSLELSHEFRKLTAQCLLLSDITQGNPQTLETLVLHVQAEYGRSRDAEPAVLLMTGICVRLAMRMGYHRDPGPFPGISPFEGEMRRRVWTFVRQCDLLISFQFGLPAMIRCDHVDTQIPRNLYDDELYEDMKSLPPSRAVFEATPMSYMITKSKMAYLFGRIVERAQSVSNPPSYDETLKFDAELREARSSHPPLLQMRSFQESARDPANLIMQRFGLEMVYLRSLFVLHRKFIAKGRENPRFSYSRRTCLNASMELLDHQATLHREAQPGGRLRSVKWYISSLTTHDFLLAAMLVCLDLYHTAESERAGRRSTSDPSSPLVPDLCDGDRREQMMQAVAHCITIWESVRDHSMEAFKASTTLRVMMEKLKAHTEKHKNLNRENSGGSYSSGSSQQQPQSMSNAYPQRAPNYSMYSNGHVGEVNTDDLPPEQSAAMTLGMLSSGGISPGPGFGMNMSSVPEKTTSQPYPASMAALLNDPMTTEQPRTGLIPQYAGPDALNAGPASPMSQMMANAGFIGMDGADIDWGAWDSYIQGTNTGMDPNLSWPMNMDMANDATGSSQGQQQSPQQQNGSNGFGVFMGAPGGGMM
ncbi:related to transcription activator protein acu-15 [Ramularia collo-cygni]|uniref:Related to transcription activator protein acu-15 n=1 Tax=Ramularia collo-cygni TaxID=112498 RepID=A0A2D3VMB7_9PEZI|nr:related to transcription activator protein acu-15 [Ramularia collo-cygni]CZT22718.1 related to transcription activator protein acu-15 [Ramularia collo-cygni]